MCEPASRGPGLIAARTASFVVMAVESPAGLGAVALGIPVYLWAAHAPRPSKRAAMNRRIETAETWPMGDRP